MFYITAYIDSFASMARKPDRSRITFCSHHRQGISLPTDRKPWIDFEKLAKWIYFVRVCQKGKRGHMSSLSFFVELQDAGPFKYLLSFAIDLFAKA